MMSQQTDHGPADPADMPRVPFGGPRGPRTMTLSHDLAAAVLYDLWKTSPDKFGNHVKRAMADLWADTASSNGRGHG